MTVPQLSSRTACSHLTSVKGRKSLQKTAFQRNAEDFIRRGFLSGEEGEEKKTKGKRRQVASSITFC